MRLAPGLKTYDVGTVPRSTMTWWDDDSILYTSNNVTVQTFIDDRYNIFSIDIYIPDLDWSEISDSIGHINKTGCYMIDQ